MCAGCGTTMLPIMAIDTLTLGSEPPGPTHRRTPRLLVIATVLSGLALLLMIGGQHRREPGALGSPAPLNVLVLGDASAAGEGCPGCASYVDQLAAAWSDGGRREVRIVGKTVAVDAELASSSMPALVETLRSDADLRDAVFVADVIMLAMGSSEVTRPAAAPCRSTRPASCPESPIGEFRESLTDWLAETDAIRQHQPVMLRVITPPPASGLPRQNHVARAACQVAAAHHAVCVNVYNMARTDEHLVAAGHDPGHPRLTQHGHDLVASQLLAIGLT